MFYRQRWLVLFTLVCVFVSTCFIASPRALASSHAPLGPTLNQCNYASSPTVIVTYNNWKNTAYFCGGGYLGVKISNVNEVYNVGGGPLWFKWYSEPIGHYCSFKGEIGEYKNFPQPVLITQIDYGDSHEDSYCGK